MTELCGGRGNKLEVFLTKQSENNGHIVGVLQAAKSKNVAPDENSKQ